MNKDEKVANINIRLKDFFSKWIEFTKPFHNLNGRQQSVLALLLYHHHRLSFEITNNKILWKEVFDYETKQLIYEELEIASGGLENLLSQLRKKNVIVNNKVTPHYIPNIDKKSKSFKIIFNFNFVNG